MANDYRIVLSGRNIFREIELPAEGSSLRVGTTIHSDVRFRRDLFFSPFELEFTRTGSSWTVACSEGDVYLSTDGVMRLMIKRLDHGDSMELRYADTGATLFSLTFGIDFEREAGDYDRIVSLQGIQRLTIGGTDACNLQLKSAYTASDQLVIERSQDGRLILQDLSTRFGAYINGHKLMGSEWLLDKSFFSVASFYFYYDHEQLRCSKDASIEFRGVTFQDKEPRCETSTYPLFTRNTRIKSVMDDTKVPVLDPPNAPNKPQGNVVMQLLPILIMVALVVVLRFFMSSSSNMMYIFMSVAMMSVGVLTSVFGFISERRGYKKACADRVKGYKAYIEGKREDLRGYRKEELQVLDKRYPAPDRELSMVQEFSGDLFDRVAEDEDFLDVRLGSGPRESVKQVDFKERERFESDELNQMPAQLQEEFRYVQNAPVTVEFGQVDALGVVGSDAQLHDMLKTMVVDVACRQFPTDAKIFFITKSENEPLIHWARNLPHVQNEELGRRNIVCDAESRNVLFEYLYKTLSDREANKGGKDEAILPHFVIFVVDEVGLKNHPLSKFIPVASSLGATFVFFEGYKEYLPVGCDQIVFLSGQGQTEEGSLLEADNDRHSHNFSYQPISDYSAWMVARTLAPVYSEEVSLEGTLTKSYGLFQMLGVMAAEDLDLGSRWKSSVVYRSMAAPIGLSKSGVVELDLSDKADGPHGLVAGTTGSGKSELLLTYLVSLATLFHPYEVAFMIIDFKGGGMAYQLRGLPHLIGTITNIDGREIERSLKSIRAELQKRQRYFAEAGVNHIDAYIKKFKAGEVKRPLPHLIIVVDEFAELKADQPEFMRELISAARIGRSLGVHLILATQKPAGQVDDQIWSNSRFRLCLKVQSKEDSNEVLKSPLAAEIKEPGRAYLQVGNNERFELFQSAYSGGPEHQDEEDVHEFTIYEVENSGKRIPIYQRRRERSDELRTTQLEAVTACVSRYCRRAGIAQLPSIILPPLPQTITYSGGAFRQDGIALGVYDDPDNQYQGEAVFDLAGANTFIVGSSQMGKTNLLEVMVRAIAEGTTPLQSTIYIMDFGSMILKNFERLNHVGGVVLATEDEKVKNLFKLLGEQIALRKQRLLKVGVSSFSSYLEAGYTDLPQIYVLMDNFSVFREVYADRYEADLLSMANEGPAYGVSLVVTNASTQGFGYKYMSSFSNRIALNCNNSAEYSTVFDHCRLEPGNVPGRGICSLDKSLFEFQTYLGFGGELEIERVHDMQEFVERTNAANYGMHARRIPNVPDDLTLDYIAENYDVPAGKLALSLSYETVAPVCIDLASQFELGLVGEGNGGARKQYLATFLKALEGLSAQAPVEAYVVDNIQRDLAAYESKSFVREYHRDPADVDGVVAAVRERFDERMARVREDGVEAVAQEPYLVVLVNTYDGLRHLCDAKKTLAAYNAMREKANDMRIFFLFAEVNDEAVTFSAPAILKPMRNSRRVVLFSNMADQKFLEVMGSEARQLRAPLAAGQAIAYAGSKLSKIRFAR